MTGTNYTVASATQLGGKDLSKSRKARDMKSPGKKGANLTKKGTASSSNTVDDSTPSFVPKIIASDEDETTLRSVRRIQQRHALDEPLYDDELSDKNTDGSTNSSPNSLTRKDSQRSRTNSQVTEIYFSPINVSFNKVERSDPLPTPPLTPTQERYDATQAAAKESAPADLRRRRNRSAPERKKLHLSREQLDRLVAALADSPLIQSHAECTTPKAAANPLPIASTRTNPIFCPNPTTVPRVRLGGMALIDPKANGSPVRFLTEHYRHRTDVLRVGKDLYLNLPYGKGVGCYLRTEPSRVVMQMVDQTLERKTGKMNYFLVVELDVTESFTKAALTELAGQSGLQLDDIEVAPTPIDGWDGSSVDIDWCALADELEESCDISNVVDKTLHSFETLQMDTSSMQTLTLVSELERIKRKHQDFLILRSHSEHENGVPSRMSVPWMSQHLESKSLSDLSLSSDSTRKFREDLIGIVAKQSFQNDPFTAKVKLASEEKTLVFMPLSASGGEKNVAWICFVRDSLDI